MKKQKFSENRKEFLTKPVEELLNLLSSEDLQIKFFAEMALRDKTST